LILQLSG